MTVSAHPAKWSERVLDNLQKIVIQESERLGRQLRLLDPFAGVGAIRLQEALRLEAHVTGIELEQEWCGPQTIRGTALGLPFADDTFDAIVTSPAYGNRMADSHEARDTSKRNTYRHTLGRPLTPGNSGGLQWGERYRQFHETAWVEALRVLKPGGLVVINVSNHIRAGRERHVAEWHLNTFLIHGCSVWEVHRVRTPRNRYGENYDVRVDGELVMVLRAP